LKKFAQLVLLVFAVTLITSCGQLIKPKLNTELTALKSGQYKVDPLHTALLFKVNHLGFAKYVGRFSKFEASLDFDPEKMDQARLSARVDMSSVEVNSEKLKETLISGSWFNVAKYPYASFETTSARIIDENTAIFSGDMTFLGNNVPVDIEVSFNGGGVNILTASYTIGFEANVSFLRSDFGLDKFIPAIGDEIELEIHAEFQKR